jgi:hypothetical protein
MGAGFSLDLPVVLFRHAASVMSAGEPAASTSFWEYYKDMGRQKGNIDPKGITMCTRCRHMVQTYKMNKNWYNGNNVLLCPNCYAEVDEGIPNPKKEESNLDPEMRELEKYLKDKGLM